MKKYSVYENNKPCTSEGFPQLKSHGWNNNTFDTFDEAQKYADKWLGAFASPLEVNTPYDYSGYGDMIEIKEEESC